jgi:uncharacterized repeat protein (TIGR01451 family)
MKGFHAQPKRWLALTAAAALTTLGLVLTVPGTASAATCSDGNLICGTDFSAVAGIEFSGQVGTEGGTSTVPGSCDPPTIDWGDGTPTSVGTMDCTLGQDLHTTVPVVGNHTYAAPGTYTVTLTMPHVLLNGVHPTATATAFVRQLQADLDVTMAAPSTARNGGTLVYAIGVSNLGPDPARNAVLVDNLPYGTLFAAVTATGWTCSTPPVGKPGGTVTCTIDPLAANSHVATSIGVKVKAHTSRGVITNAATVSSDTPDPNTSNNTASVQTTIVK